jgi:hypothetical protein
MKDTQAILHVRATTTAIVGVLLEETNEGTEETINNTIGENDLEAISQDKSETTEKKNTIGTMDTMIEETMKETIEIDIMKRADTEVEMIGMISIAVIIKKKEKVKEENTVVINMKNMKKRVEEISIGPPLESINTKIPKKNAILKNQRDT